MGTPISNYLVKKIFYLWVLYSKLRKSGDVKQRVYMTLLVLLRSLRTVLATQDRTLKLG
jgi:hypothetical protein